MSELFQSIINTAPDQFAKTKGLGFLVVFILATIIQFAIPWKMKPKQIFKNWFVNLLLSAMNSVIIMIICPACVCHWAKYLRNIHWGFFEWNPLPLALELITTILILDFTAYIWHRANHRWKILWPFHSVHHSDTVFETSTALRFHIGELAISLIIRIIVVTLFGISISGLIVFELVYQFFNVFIHGNIRLPEKFENWMAYLFVTPALHRKHHSIKGTELNSNFGTIFSFWDRIFKTFIPSSSKEDIQVGLPGLGNDLSFSEAVMMPIVNGN